MTLHYEGLLFILVGVVALLLQGKMRNSTLSWWRYWSPKSATIEKFHEGTYGPMFVLSGIVAILLGFLVLFGIV
jgi:uncharacterized membrane protein